MIDSRYEFDCIDTVWRPGGEVPSPSSLANIEFTPPDFSNREDYQTWSQNVFIYGMVIQNAVDEVYRGIRDGTWPRWRWARMRADALMFFIIGDYHDILAYCGYVTEIYPAEVDEVLGIVASLASALDDCPTGREVEDIVWWAYKNGHLDNDDFWKRVDKLVEANQNGKI